MKIHQQKFSEEKGWETLRNDDFDAASCNFILAFGSREIISKPEIFDLIRKNYPGADIVLNSTSGEITDTYVSDNSITLTGILFEKTEISAASIQIENSGHSYEAGFNLGKKINPVGLKYAMVISDGQKVNGSELVLGLQDSLPQGTIITGGLAGDGGKFEKTVVGLNGIPEEGKIVLVGFYGKNLTVTYGSVGGWDTFGPERLITKAKANILYELDGKPALDIYKAYLGEYAVELPKSGLLFPLSVRSDGANNSLVRTLLSVNESERSLTFAGNMPEGSYARLMNANFDNLIEGASEAAQNSMDESIRQPDLAILISCVGRKLVLDQRVEEEIEVVRNVFNNKTAITGFYSYGEISPSFNFLKCELHNQTMTITTLTEK